MFLFAHWVSTQMVEYVRMCVGMIQPKWSHGGIFFFFFFLD